MEMIKNQLKKKTDKGLFKVPEKFQHPSITDDFGDKIDMGNEKMSRIAILAPSKGGKTHRWAQMMKSILTKNGEKDFGPLGTNFYIFLVQPTYDTNRAYKDGDILNKILETKEFCEIHTEWNRKTASKLEFLLDQKKSGSLKKTLIVVLDDLGDKSGMKKGETAAILNDIANAGSQIPGFVFFGLFQKVTQMGTNMRTNFDAFYLFKFKTKSDLDQIRINFFPHLTSVEFHKMYRKLYRKKYSFIEVLNLDGGISVIRQDGEQLEY